MNEIRGYFGQRNAVGPIPLETWERFLRRHVSDVLSSFTVTYGTGYWKGVPERVAILETVNDEELFDVARENMLVVARLWNLWADQECVLVACPNENILETAR